MRFAVVSRTGLRQLRLLRTRPALDDHAAVPELEPAFGSVDRLRAELARYEPFSSITVGDITSDARRGGQSFSMRISLLAPGAEGAS